MESGDQNGGFSVRDRGKELDKDKLKPRPVLPRPNQAIPSCLENPNGLNWRIREVPNQDIPPRRPEVFSKRRIQSRNPFHGQKLTLNTLKQFDPAGTGQPENGSVSVHDQPNRVPYGAVARRPRRNYSSHNSSLMLMTILSMLCDSKCEGNKDRGRILFDYMCKKLKVIVAIDMRFTHDSLSPICGQFYNGIENLIGNFVQTKFGSSPVMTMESSMALNTYLSNILLPLDVPIASYVLPRRYANEFLEIECLGRGAFGQVFKVKNKCDNVHYAIKKIPISFQNDKDLIGVKREVHTIANFKNSNIIGYYGSWYETCDCPAVGCPGTESQASSPKESHGNNFERSFERLTGQAQSMEVVRRSNFFLSRSISTEEGSSSRIDNLADSMRSVCLASYSSNKIATSRSDKRHLPFTHSTNCQRARAKQGVPLILHIQMELGGKTLEHFLETRNRKLSEGAVAFLALDGAMSENIFYQILSGVEHIHSRGVIHRDLKPSNIFVNETDSLSVKIGDFGLARPDWNCNIEEMCSDNGPLTPMTEQLTADVGTKTYAAPEQLDGGQYDQKADMYSLGIINFELFYPMGTGMEMSKVITMLKKKKGMCEHVERIRSIWPFQASVIEKLLKKDPDERPTAKEILVNRPVKSDKDIINELQDKLQQKDKLIAIQASKIEELDKVRVKYKKNINRLKAVLAKQLAEKNNLIKRCQHKNCRDIFLLED